MLSVVRRAGQSALAAAKNEDTGILNNQIPQDAMVAEIRANIVFEKLLLAVLSVAAATGAAHFAFGLIWRASAVGVSFSGFIAALIGALTYAGFFFIAGFGISVALGVPLFRALEKAKYRKAWPYIAASFVAGFVLLAFAGKAPSVEAPARIIHLLPGVAVAALFARNMRPLWRAADRADENPAPNVFRLN